MNILRPERRQSRVRSKTTLKIRFFVVNLQILRYHVPAHIQEHVDYITPGIKLFAQKRRPNPNSALQRRDYKLPPLLESLGMTVEALLAIPELLVCSIAITPACIKALYNVTAPAKAATGNELGIFEDLGDVYSQTDLNLFFASFAQ
jgi:tripeptidyl-peptidase I